RGQASPAHLRIVEEIEGERGPLAEARERERGEATDLPVLVALKRPAEVWRRFFAAQLEQDLGGLAPDLDVDVVEQAGDLERGLDVAREAAAKRARPAAVAGGLLVPPHRGDVGGRVAFHAREG